jgi:hypothetical protein
LTHVPESYGAIDAESNPAAVTWSVPRMADTAVARLKQCRAEPNLAPTFQGIAMTFRVAS